MNLGRPGFANEPRGAILDGMRHSPWIALSLGCLLATGCAWNKHAQPPETAPSASTPATIPVASPPPAVTPTQPPAAPEAVVTPDARETERQPPVIEPARPTEPVLAPRTAPPKPPAAIPAAPKSAAPKPPPVVATLPPPRHVPPRRHGLSRRPLHHRLCCSLRQRRSTSSAGDAPAGDAGHRRDDQAFAEEPGRRSRGRVSRVPQAGRARRRSPSCAARTTCCS